MSDLDHLLIHLGRKDASIPIVEGASFMVGLKKLAEELGAAPDTTGQIEGPFLIPLPEAVELMAQMVSNEFKTQVYYTYYANMLRGLAHEGIAEEFTEHAGDELEHANYLLRRIGVLSPGGVSIPPYPPPPPMTDPQQIVQSMIVVEQLGISLWKRLHSILGENPMKYTVEQYLQKEEEHQDELWQLVDPTATSPLPTTETTPEVPKMASEILDAAMQRRQASDPDWTRRHVRSTYNVLHQRGQLTPEGITHFESLKANPDDDSIHKFHASHFAPELQQQYAAAKARAQALSTEPKTASHALDRQELLRAGMDPSYAGKKEHDVSAKEKKSFMIIPLPPIEYPTEYGKAKAEVNFHKMSPEEREQALGNMRLHGALLGGVSGAGLGGMGSAFAQEFSHSPVSPGGALARAAAGGLGGALLGGTAGYLAAGHSKDRAVESGELPAFKHMKILHHLNKQEADKLRVAYAAEQQKEAADLTADARAQVKETNFVFPETRKYPIHDKDHALAALGLVGMHGSAEEKAAVREAVNKKYPGLQMQKKADFAPRQAEDPNKRMRRATEGSVGRAGRGLEDFIGSLKKADRDEVIKAKAKSLITAATENLRKMTDLLPKADQNRVEIISRPPESLVHEKAVFDTKKKEPVTKQANVLHGSLVGAGLGAGLGAGAGALLADEGHRLEGAGYGALGGGLGGAYAGGRAGQSLAKHRAWRMKVDAQTAHINDLLAQVHTGRAAHEAQLAAARAEREAIIPNAIAAAKEQLGKTSSLGALISKLAEDVMLPPPGADTPESYVAREQQLAAQQAMAEASHAKTVSMQSAQAAQQAQAEAQAAQQQLQEAQAQLQQSQQEAQVGSQQALQAQQQAAEAEARAAEHSISKMQLGMRVNQLRQELANLVMQDPVSEHAATVSDLAAQGQPATPQQQAEAEAAQQMAAVDPATGQPAQPSAEAQQEGQEAQNAQQHAETQQAQADQAQQADQAKAQPKQASKLASLIDATARKAGRAAAEGAGEALTETAKKYAPHAAAIGLSGGALAALHSHRARGERKEDMASAVAEGMRRAKSASLADRRLAQAIMSGERDALGQQLIDVVKHGLPAEAALAGAGHAIRSTAEEGGKAVAAGLPTLGEKLRPHLPGLVAGLGTGIIGTKMLSGGGQQQPQATSPLGYAQYYGQ